MKNNGYSIAFARYFAGKNRTNSSARVSNLWRSASSPKARESALTQPFMRLVPDIMGTMPGILSAQASLSLPKRTNIPSSRAPQSRLPLSNHAQPANMAFPVMPCTDLNSSFTSSSRPWSRAMIFFNSPCCLKNQRGLGLAIQLTSRTIAALNSLILYPLSGCYSDGRCPK
jgi:hypothetical protein